MTIQSRNENISYTLVPLIMYEGSSFDIVYYYSDIFYFSTVVLWHCDDDLITRISYFPEGVYIREIWGGKRYKNKNAMVKKCLIGGLY